MEQEEHETKSMTLFLYFVLFYFFFIVVAMYVYLVFSFFLFHVPLVPPYSIPHMTGLHDGVCIFCLPYTNWNLVEPEERTWNNSTRLGFDAAASSSSKEQKREKALYPNCQYHWPTATLGVGRDE